MVKESEKYGYRIGETWLLPLREEIWNCRIGEIHFAGSKKYCDLANF